MVSLRGHLGGDVAYQVLSGQTTVNFDKLFYRNEHQMSFEFLVANFTIAIMTRRELVGPLVIQTLSMLYGES